MQHAARIAVRTHLATLSATRANRILGIVAIGTVALAGVGVAIGKLGSMELSWLRHGILVPGIPLAAAVMAEVPLREGMTHRTLLYPLLGPVPRSTLAIVRTTIAAIVLALTAAATLWAVGMLGGVHPDMLLRETAAAALGAFAYTGIFSLLHLLTKRGLVAALLLYFLVDGPLGRLPFELRHLAPSTHVRSVARLSPEDALIPFLEAAPGSPAVSAIVLAVLGAAGLALTAWHFARRDLGELC